MLKRKLGLLVAAAVMVGMFTSCVNVIKNDKENEGSGDQTPTTQEPEIDYTNYTGSDYSIKVRNDSSKNVVCFKGTPSASTLISGARGGQTTGLKLNKALFSQSEDFVLWVFTEEDYLAKKNNFDELKKAPFALIYAYYNTDSASNANMVYTISASMGGESYIILNNPTNYNVELRQNGLYGESLAFAGANTVQTKINVAYGDYYIYPVFRKFQKKTGEIVTCFPKTKGTDRPVYLEYSLSESGDHSQEFNVMKWFDPDAFKDYSTPGSAFITIQNGNEMSGVSLYKGGNAEAAVTSTGGKKINTGKTLTFEVPMVATSGKTFASTASISGWQVGTSQQTTKIPAVTEEDKTNGTVTLEAGKMYYLDVTGADAYTVNLSWRMKDGVIVTDVVNYEDE